MEHDCGPSLLPASQRNDADGAAPAREIKRLIRLREVQHRVGVGRSTIYRWMADGIFPQPVQLGKRSVGWIEQEIDDWLRSRSR